MSEGLSGGGPTLTGYRGSTFGEALLIDFDSLTSIGSGVDSIAGLLESTGDRLTKIASLIQPLLGTEELDQFVTSFLEPVARAVTEVNLVSGLLREEAEAVREYVNEIKTAELLNLALLSPFQQALAFNGSMGEKPDDVISESTSVYTVEVSIGPEAKVKIPKVNVRVGAAATLSTVVREHVKELRDGTIEVTFAQGGGFGTEGGAGPKSKPGVPDFWGAGVDAEFGAAGATTYRVTSKADLRKLEKWVSDGHTFDRLTRGDHPGVELSTTKEISASEALDGSLNRGGDHSFAGGVKATAVQTIIKHGSGGLRRGDTITSLSLSGSTTAALQKELGLPKAAVGGTSTYKISIVNGSDGQIKSIDIAETSEVSASASKKWGSDNDPHKRSASLHGGGSYAETTVHHLDLSGNPTLQAVLTRAYVVASYKGGSREEGLFELDRLIRANAIRTTGITEAVDGGGGSLGGHLGVGIEGSVEKTETTPVSPGTTTTPSERSQAKARDD